MRNPGKQEMFMNKYLRTSLSIQSLFQSSLFLIYLQVESCNTCKKYKHSIMSKILHKGKYLASSSKTGSSFDRKLSVMNTFGGKKKHHTKKSSWCPCTSTQRPDNPRHSPACPTPQSL